jgi:Ca2+-transporting ATPase
VLQRPPRNAQESILLAGHWYAIAGYGVLIAAAVLGAFASASSSLGLDQAQAVSISFLTFGFARLWHVLNMRSPRSPLMVNEVTRNGFVWVALGSGVLLLLAAAYAPLLPRVLEVDAPAANGWLLLLGFSLLPLVIAQVMKWRGLLWEQPRGSEWVADRG